MRADSSSSNTSFLQGQRKLSPAEFHMSYWLVWSDILGSKDLHLVFEQSWVVFLQERSVGLGTIVIATCHIYPPTSLSEGHRILNFDSS